MDATFVAVETPDDQERLATLAGTIWNEYWPALIGQQQTDYMVENFQSLAAIKRDMAQNRYEYWFIKAADDGRVVGYTGGHEERVAWGDEKDRYFISKIYLLDQERGHGFASQTIAFYKRLCQERGLPAAYLTVNKHNELGIRAYQGKGFKTIASVESDIGCGFIMDDYVMELEVEPA